MCINNINTLLNLSCIPFSCCEKSRPLHTKNLYPQTFYTNGKNQSKPKKNSVFRLFLKNFNLCLES